MQKPFSTVARQTLFNTFFRAKLFLLCIIQDEKRKLIVKKCGMETNVYGKYFEMANVCNKVGKLRQSFYVWLKLLQHRRL